MPDRQDQPLRSRRFVAWLGDNAGGAAVSLVVVAVLGAVGTQVLGGDSTSLGEQLDAIRENAAKEGKYAVLNRGAALHGEGETSRLFVFRPRRGTESGLVGASDEVRVYDEVGSNYELSFHFQPRSDPQPYRFKLQGVGRFDETDRQEIVGYMTHVFADGQVPYPVVIVWDENLGGYRLRSLLPEPLRTTLGFKPGTWGRIARDRYVGHVLRDTKSQMGVRVFGADAFGVRRSPFPVFAAAFTLRAECNACAHLIELRAWKMDFEQPVPAILSCDGPNGPRLRWPSGLETVEPVSEWLRLAPYPEVCF